MAGLPIGIVPQLVALSAHGACDSARRRDMVEQRAEGRFGAGRARGIAFTILFAAFFSAAPNGFADQVASLTVERSSKQVVVLTQGFSTTIHGERPFGKVFITDPDVVDLVLRTDKSAVLIPQRLGRTNIDFLDEHGNLMGSMDVRVVRQTVNDRVVIYNRPSLGAYSVFHCGANGCEHFDEVPAKEAPLSGRFPMGLPQ